MWTLPILLLAVTILLSIPLSAYFAWIMDGRYKASAPLAWFEPKVNSGTIALSSFGELTNYRLETSAMFQECVSLLTAVTNELYASQFPPVLPS